MFGPSTSAMIRGGRGHPERFITKPSNPIDHMSTKSPMDLAPSHDPMNTNRITTGTSRWPSMKIALATCRPSTIRRSADATFAIMSVQTIENVMWRLEVSISMPGLRPWIIMAPSRIAIAKSPGMPKVMVGISAPPRWALLALSGAITPRMSPRPNSFLPFVVCTAIP